MVARTFFILLLMFCSKSILADRSRDKKLFSLFNVVTFKNDPCKAKSDPDLIGTCYTSTECISKSGTTDGNCAAGFGVCCTFTLNTCGSTVNQNCTYIQNPSFPNTYSTSGPCAFTVNYISSDICQLRLDFTMFDIAEDTGLTGTCLDSFDVVGPTGRNPPTICGTNTGQHLYIETGRSGTATTLTFTISTSGGGNWKFKVTQLECTSNARARPDCLQYFTGRSGEIKSLNFDGGLQLRNIQYTICIRHEAGFCGIQYTVQDNTTPDSFLLNNANGNLNGGTDATGGTSYVGIPGSNTDLYSGTILSAQAGSAEMTDGVLPATGGPFVLEVINRDTSQASTTGFDLIYTQTACGLAKAL